MSFLFLTFAVNLSSFRWRQFYWTSALHWLQRKKKSKLYLFHPVPLCFWGWVSLAAGWGKSSRRLSPQLFSSSLWGTRGTPGLNRIFNHSSMLGVYPRICYHLDVLIQREVTRILSGLKGLVLTWRCSSSELTLIPTDVWALWISTDSRYPTEETHSSRLYPKSHSFSHEPKPVTTCVMAGTRSTRKCKSFACWFTFLR